MYLDYHKFEFQKAQKLQMKSMEYASDEPHSQTSKINPC